MNPFEAWKLYRLVNKIQEAWNKITMTNMGWKTITGAVLVAVCAALKFLETAGVCQGCGPLADALTQLGAMLGVSLMGVGLRHAIAKQGSKIVLLALLLSPLAARAQTFDAYEAGGGTYLQTPSAVQGHLAVVKDISSTVFSYTVVDFSQISTGTPITSVRTGLGTFIDAIGPAQLFGVVDGGGTINSTQSGTSSSGAFASGLLVGIPLRSNLALMFAAQALTSGPSGWNPLFEAGIVFKPNAPAPVAAARKLSTALRHIF